MRAGAFVTFAAQEGETVSVVLETTSVDIYVKQGAAGCGTQVLDSVPSQTIEFENWFAPDGVWPLDERDVSCVARNEREFGLEQYFVFTAPQACTYLIDSPAPPNEANYPYVFVFDGECTGSEVICQAVPAEIELTEGQTITIGVPSENLFHPGSSSVVLQEG